MSTLAAELMSNGFAFVSVSPALVTRARAEYLNLIEVCRNYDVTTTAFTRPGEDEPDLGVIFKAGGVASDYKYYLHYGCDWKEHVRPPLRTMPTQALRDLYQFNNRLSLTITALLMRRHSPLFLLENKDERNSSLLSMAQAGRTSVPYGTNVLRGLYYPASTGNQVQTGAKGHYDRSFLSIHLGDAGGQLIAHTDETDLIGTTISPPEGKAVVFFGVKAAIVTDNRLKPLWHSSRTESGKDRTAMVHFSHVAVEQPVTHAGVAYRELKERLLV